MCAIGACSYGDIASSIGKVEIASGYIFAEEASQSKEIWRLDSCKDFNEYLGMWGAWGDVFPPVAARGTSSFAADQWRPPQGHVVSGFPPRIGQMSAAEGRASWAGGNIHQNTL